MRAKEVWGIFHTAWKNELKQANLFGWPLAVCWVVLAFDYYMMNWHARGTFDVAVSGVLFVLAGHFVGLLTPASVYHHVISTEHKQLLAMVSGGIAGLMAFVGVTLLLHRRLTDARIRATSKTSDIALLWIFWVQLALGLATIPLSAQHLDGSMMMRLAEWGQRIVTFRSGAVEMLAGAGWVFKAHLFLGMTVFLIFPFTRLVHVWSGFGTLAYVLRPYQLVRARRLNVPPGQNEPRRSL